MEFNIHKISEEVKIDEPFDFSGCIRNMALCEGGFKPPEVWSTGTTVVGAIFKGGVVIGGDCRSTMRGIIANKQAIKVYELTKSIFACGAGSSADLKQMAKLLSANLHLHELNTGKKARVVMAVQFLKQHLFQYGGHVRVHMLIGGIDISGIQLYRITAHGFTQSIEYGADGSGSFIADSYLDRHFKQDMTEQECIDLVKNALSEGMKGDNASGNALIMASITENGSHIIGPIAPEFCTRVTPIDLEYKFQKGKTIVLKEKTIKYDIVEEEEKRMEVDPK